MIKFTKMEGLGNDYVYVDCTQMSENQISEISKLAVKISDRHFGIGSDGLILICKSSEADFKMVFKNKSIIQRIYFYLLTRFWLCKQICNLPYKSNYDIHHKKQSSS